MRQQRLLDLRAGDVVARGDDHVVAARLVPEVAVLVAEKVSPVMFQPLLHVHRLARVGEVAAAGRALDRQPARLAGGHRVAVAVDDRRRRSRAPARPVEPGRMSSSAAEMKMCSISVDADAVDDLDAGRVAERLPGRRRQVLARGHGRAAASTS